MNRLAIRSQIRILIGETLEATSYVTDTDVNTQIDNSMLAVSVDIPCLFTYSETSAVVDQQRYGMPVDLIQLKGVQVFRDATTREALERLSYDDFEAIYGVGLSNSATPIHYRAEFGATSVAAGSPPGDIWLGPSPDSTYTIRIVYYQRTTSSLSTDTDVPELPEALHMPLCYHAAWHMSLFQDNWKKAKALSELYVYSADQARKTIWKRDRTGPVSTVSPYSEIADTGPGIARKRPM